MKLRDFVPKTEAFDFFSCGILHFTPPLTQEIDTLSYVGLKQQSLLHKISTLIKLLTRIILQLLRAVSWFSNCAMTLDGLKLNI